jgi:predicted oxidoreductase
MPVQPQSSPPDAIIIGAGLAGLVAAGELIDAGKHILVLDQEPEASLGGQAWWSFGGIFLIDSPEQRRFGVKDSLELARQDWLGTAGFDRDEDAWPRQWAEAYLQFAATEKRAWLRERGVKFFPVVGWAERGGYTATGPGNSVPPLPHHLGHRPRHRRAVRSEAARGNRRRARRHPVSTRGEVPDRRGWRSGGGAGISAGGRPRGARSAQ